MIPLTWAMRLVHHLFIGGPFSFWRCSRCGVPAGRCFVAWPASDQLRAIPGPVCQGCASWVVEQYGRLEVA